MIKEKGLYRIGHLSKVLGITQRTIRYYDQLGLLPHLKRSEGSVRLFDDNDIETIKKIRHYQTSEKLNLDEIKRLLIKRDPQEKTIAILTEADVLFSFFHPKRFPIHQLKNPETPTQIKKRISQLLNTVDLIYAILPAPHYSPHFNELKELSKTPEFKSKLHIINTGSFYSGTGLLIEILAEYLFENGTESEFKLLLNKHLPLIFQAGIQQNQSYVLQHKRQSAFDEAITEKLEKHYIIYSAHAKNPHLSIHHIIDDFQTTLTELLLIINTQFQAQGNYVNRVLISHSQQKNVAETLKKELKHTICQAPIYIKELDDSPQNIGLIHVSML